MTHGKKTVKMDPMNNIMENRYLRESMEERVRRDKNQRYLIKPDLRVYQSTDNLKSALTRTIENLSKPKLANEVSSSVTTLSKPRLNQRLKLESPNVYAGL